MPGGAPVGPLLHRLVRVLPRTGAIRRMGSRSRLAVVVSAFPVPMSLAALLFGLEASIHVIRSTPVTWTVVARHE